MDERCVDLMYLACNRLEFTQETFTTLLANTDWGYVHELFVYDDGSQDGTREWLESNIGKAPVLTRFVKTNFGSPVEAMVHFIESARAPVLAKTDNDAMLPPSWLRLSLEVFDRQPELALLGIEAMYPHQDDVQLVRSYTPAQFISGLGLYRRSVFTSSRPRSFGKWFGLEEWQMAQGSGLVRGWITPAIPVFLLDRLPFEPWSTYSRDYIRSGWQRPWPKYDRTCTLWHWRWPDQPHTDIGCVASSCREVAGVIGTQNSKSSPHYDSLKKSGAPCFKVVILSAHASNLIPCVRSVLINEPRLRPDHIIVVDDGARKDAETQLPSLRWVQGVKPFIFSRNANIGIREAKADVVLLNDDARLLTPYGFSLLSKQIQNHENVGLCSAGIRGAGANHWQNASQPKGFRLESRMLAFMCVYIPKAVYDKIGPLDERFTGYGFEDNDYCARVLSAGLKLGIWNGCVVDHSGELRSTYRTRPDISFLFERNRRLFREKWGRDA